MRHMCPTAPDTIRAYPFSDCDPFIIHECPHVYFSGNQDSYGERLVKAGKVESCKQAVKIISIPKFRESHTMVLMDTTNMQTYPIKFNIGQGLIPTES